MTSAATRGACRPTAAEPTSSSRPASSSALVCLITTKIATSAAKRPAQTPYRQVVMDPSEVPSTLPYRKRSAGFAPPVAASAARPAAVGYSRLSVYAVPGHPGGDHVHRGGQPDPVPADGQRGQYPGPGQAGARPPRMSEDGHRGAPATFRSAE